MSEPKLLTTMAELKKEDISELAKRAVKEGNPTYPVPVIWENAMFEKVIEKIV